MNGASPNMRPRTGGRVCRTCNNDATRRYKARKRAEFKETSDA